MRITPLALLNVILTSILLTSVFFMNTTSTSTSSSYRATITSEYDPWIDINDDGIIDIFDLVAVATRYGSTGTPINKTALLPLLELLSRITNLEARVKALETLTKITIEAYPTTDIYLRYHALSIDEPLNVSAAWDAGKESGYEFKVTSSEFTYVRYVTLGYGSHFVEYAASGRVPDYAWHAKIYINGALKAEGDVGRRDPLRACFDVGS